MNSQLKPNNRVELCRIVQTFEANSGDYLTKKIAKRDRFPAAAAEHPKSGALPVRL